MRLRISLPPPSTVARMFSFTFGVISAEAIAAVRHEDAARRNRNTVDEAIALEESEWKS